MKITESVSMALLLTIGALCVRSSSASPATRTDPEELAITNDGVLKYKSELSVDDIVISAIPRPSSTDSGTLTVGSQGTGICMGRPMVIATGFATGFFGSYSPIGLTGGTSVQAIWDG